MHNSYVQAFNEHFTKEQRSEMRKAIVLSAHRGWAKSKIAKHLEDTYGLNTRFSHWLVSHAIPKVLANPKKGAMIDNPAKQKAVKIYDSILQIKARKGDDSLWPGELFVHDFAEKSKAAIYGLENGDILIHSHSGKRLHKKFSYPSRSRG